MKKTILLCITILMLVGPAVFSFEEVDSIELTQVYGREIGEINIVGNTRTKEKTILRLSQIEEGMDFTDSTTEMIERKLKKSGLFAEQTVRVGTLPDGSVSVAIEVEEKWSLIPLPVFFTDGESLMGGFVVIETNLAGTAKQVISGVMGGTDGLSGFAVYVDPALFQSPWGLSVSASAGVEEQEVDRPDGSLAYLIDGEKVGASFGIGYNFYNNLQLEGKIRADEYFVESDGGIDLSSEKTSEQQVGIRGRYDATIPYGSLLKGPLAAFETAYLFQTESFTLKGSFEMNIPTFKGQRGRILVKGGYGEKPFYQEDSVSGLDGFRTLPFGKTFADDYWSVSAGYDIPVLQQNWGALALTAFYERGWYASSLSGDYDFHGPGGGFRVYLKRIAVPALGLDIAYNLDTDQTVFSVAVGMRM